MNGVIEAINDLELAIERVEPERLHEQLRALLCVMRRLISLRHGEQR
jgi:hypothetical protein